MNRPHFMSREEVEALLEPLIEDMANCEGFEKLIMTDILSIEQKFALEGEIVGWVLGWLFRRGNLMTTQSP